MQRLHTETTRSSDYLLKTVLLLYMLRPDAARYYEKATGCDHWRSLASGFTNTTTAVLVFFRECPVTGVTHHWSGQQHSSSGAVVQRVVDETLRETHNCIRVAIAQ